MKIYIDWKKIDKVDEFYSQLLPQLEAPDWHGRNLDALSDSLVTGSINEIEPPFCIINLNVESLTEEFKGFFLAVNEIYKEATSGGRKIRVFNE